MDNNNKRMHGKFYTITNPFHNQMFLKWFKSINNYNEQIILEPFAGSNNIVKMIEEFFNNQWDCYDIEPNAKDNRAPNFKIKQQNTILDFPKGYKVAITNPPYLAKNSASKNGIYFPKSDYDDLYKISLDVMLNNLDYVAAIIPDSFITQNIFHDRLFGVSTLNCRMFDDTECPVCLALFVPKNSEFKIKFQNDFYLYKGNVEIGLYSNLKEELNKIYKSKDSLNLKFNIPHGEIGLYAIDGVEQKSIRFIDGNEIPQSRIKSSSRGITRISGVPNDLNIKELINDSNFVLEEFRNNTNDFFMTSFRGLRKDGDYRRRLDFSLAKKILNYSYNRLGGFNA